jgi:hypothetical protein
MYEQLKEINHMYKNEKIPQSEEFYKFVKKKLILDDVTFKICENGIIITNRFNKENSEYYPWNLFEEYTENPNNFFKIFNPQTRKNHIGFKLKKDHIIHQKGLIMNYIVVPILLSRNEKVRELISSKIRVNNQKNSSEFGNISLIAMTITFLITIYIILKQYI